MNYPNTDKATADARRLVKRQIRLLGHEVPEALRWDLDGLRAHLSGLQEVPSW